MELKTRKDFLANLHYEKIKDKEYINKEQVEEIIIERVFTTQPVTHLKDLMDISVTEWGFYIGIYKCTNSIYLVLSTNYHNSLIKVIQNSYEHINDGIIKIDKNTCDILFNKIRLLGKEYFENKTNKFNLLINLILSIIPDEVKVRFGVLFNSGGCYNRKEREITINTAQSQYDILFSLIHEYVHHLLSDGSPIKRMTYEEYLYDENELICNFVACRILVILEPMQVTNEVRSKLNTPTKNINYFKELNYDILKTVENLQNNLNEIERIEEKILEELSKALEENKKTKRMNFLPEQSTLVVLNDTDNKHLLNIIFEDVAPLLIEEEKTIYVFDGIKREYTNKRTINLSICNKSANIISEIIYYTPSKIVDIYGYNFHEWCIYVCIYEIDNKKYLIKQDNYENSYLDYIFYDNDNDYDCDNPNPPIDEGAIEINEEVAKSITSSLKELKSHNKLKPLNEEDNNKLLKIIIKQISPLYRKNGKNV